jgi:hypothetical protein
MVRNLPLHPSDNVRRLCNFNTNEHHRGAIAARLPEVLARTERLSARRVAARPSGGLTAKVRTERSSLVP